MGFGLGDVGFGAEGSGIEWVVLWGVSCGGWGCSGGVSFFFWKAGWGGGVSVVEWKAVGCGGGQIGYG